MKKIFLLIYFLILTLTPSNNLQCRDIKTESAIFNTLVGGFTSGIGAVINKNKDESYLQTFAKGFLVGSAGGYIMFHGKKLNRLISTEQNLSYAYASRFVYSIGNSIVENGAENINFWDKFHYDFGFVRFEVNTNKFSIQPEILPLTFIGTIYLATKGNLEFKKTIQSGTFIFKTDIYANPEDPTSLDNFGALTPVNGIVYNAESEYYDFNFMMAHEFVHTFQHQDFSGINLFFKPQFDSLKNKYPKFNKLCQWISPDLNVAMFYLNYFVIQGGLSNWDNNFLEMEAEGVIKL
ncbi:MAG: hypothetical protein A2X64_07945 [Ignavibacteria bacterium GWF2_33_9]|nr:MAG: hypothetical protein A2X64_07945 [Ignavibacteria bacterium GWF2_33_9]